MLQYVKLKLWVSKNIVSMCMRSLNIYTYPYHCQCALLEQKLFIIIQKLLLHCAHKLRPRTFPLLSLIQFRHFSKFHQSSIAFHGINNKSPTTSMAKWWRVFPIKATFKLPRWSHAGWRDAGSSKDHYWNKNRILWWCGAIVQRVVPMAVCERRHLSHLPYRRPKTWWQFKCSL